MGDAPLAVPEQLHHVLHAQALGAQDQTVARGKPVEIGGKLLGAHAHQFRQVVAGARLLRIGDARVVAGVQPQGLHIVGAQIVQTLQLFHGLGIVMPGAQDLGPGPQAGLDVLVQVFGQTQQGGMATPHEVEELLQAHGRHGYSPKLLQTGTLVLVPYFQGVQGHFAPPVQHFAPLFQHLPHLRAAQKSRKPLPELKPRGIQTRFTKRS